jgi:vacuolar-type H+-ATPase subunit E/Vma4
MRPLHFQKDGKSAWPNLLTELTSNYSSGGLSIVGGGGKIDINNTFDERLKLLEDNALPAIRTTLFGKNDNRKFYD